MEEVADIDMSLVDMPYLTSKNKMNGLAYIGGYIVRKLSQSIDCATCCRAMISNDTTKSHFALIRVKDNGGLVYPSDDIVKILEVCDKYFNDRNNGDGISASKNLRAKLQHSIVSELSITRPGNVLFSSLLEHDIETHTITEDFHSTQIMKATIASYLKMRLLRYAQEYTNTVIKKVS